MQLTTQPANNATTATLLALHKRGLESFDVPQLIWAHGWGVDHRTLLPIAQSFDASTSQILFDFPGFGQAPLPPKTWNTQDYADLVIEYLQTLPQKKCQAKRIWVAHSFGARVGLRIAAREPDLLDGLFLIAGAGLQRRRTPVETIVLKSKVYTYKALKPLIHRGLVPEGLKQRFGSTDYRAAGPMRGVLLRVIQEDLTQIAQKVKCPVHLLYGAQDQETPPEMGRRFAELIPNAKLTVLEHFDHANILTEGRAQVSYLLQQFLQSINKK
ncbi:MAG: alpha/beta hydrolase [Pseudomonadota bacterium]